VSPLRFKTRLKLPHPVLSFYLKFALNDVSVLEARPTHSGLIFVGAKMFKIAVGLFLVSCLQFADAQGIQWKDYRQAGPATVTVPGHTLRINGTTNLSERLVYANFLCQGHEYGIHGRSLLGRQPSQCQLVCPVSKAGEVYLTQDCHIVVPEDAGTRYIQPRSVHNESEMGRAEKNLIDAERPAFQPPKFQSPFEKR